VGELQIVIPGPRTAEQTAESGILAGIAASFPMALVWMIASASVGDGFFTPMYHVAFVVDPHTWPDSLRFAAAGEATYFRNEPFFFGVAMHVVVGGFFGVVFALGARWLRPPRRLALMAGTAYGLVVMAVMSVVALPIIANAVDGGDPIALMGAEVGWPIFVLDHLVYGLGLGLWLRWRPQDAGLPVDPVSGPSSFSESPGRI
jgi:hypothetical protein